jgi:hypothetical protein
VTTEIAAAKRRRSNLDRYAHNLGLGRTSAWRADDHVKVLASRHGRDGEYIGHLVTQPFVHGSTMATSQRYSVADETTVQIGGAAAQLEVWARDAGRFASYSTLHAARAVCRIFDWDEPQEIQFLINSIEASPEPPVPGGG